MNPGRLRHRITLQRFTKARNDFGEVIEEWEELGKCWAEVKPVNGKETFVAQQFVAQSTHEVWMRFRKDIKASDRVIDHHGNVLEIKTPIDIGGRGRQLKLLCRQVGF
ncbi:hypothetical protein GZ77_20490 [Endozoicomonas montiporae]|uniref:Head-tail adaptor protein n=2 Tax=Endozoicomonas montiporae TaxID=1027273 RepID=A0A081N307_9GAMM|nr:phage head closure protein [Endozoicomonas montiporae]AMO58116.1 phage head-tail adaptor [Endozoicomonas montiporae CL-33]KEQ12830.1 hypothetical protein GZ77_20490 [Endozoicomonas montiporae]